MAKRADPDEKPFRPLERSLIQSVLAGSAAQAAEASQAGVGEVLPPEPPRNPPSEQPRSASTQETPSPSPQIFNLDHERANTAASRVRPRIPPPRRETPTAIVPDANEPFDRMKRFLLSASEERALERFVGNFGAEFGTTLKTSHVLRSLIVLLLNAEPELLERAAATGRLQRPANGDAAAIAEFERQVAAVIAAGLRNARLPR
jgi:hypothetical protein